MYPITKEEKKLAIVRVRASASSLIHDRVINENEFRLIMDRAHEAFGEQNTRKEAECIDHNNGAQST